jgi:trehalose-6-phosphate hydrolase
MPRYEGKEVNNLAGFKNKVIYQIYTKSFNDSNGDGLGDLRGIIEKLDYLAALEVDYLWLTPFFQSPQKDNGYDVADYISIDPLFGTMADFDELIREAKQRKIGLMLDMVFNHTSTEHEWFKKALKGEPEYMDYYIFKDGNKAEAPTNWVSKFGGSAWEYETHLNKWYLHLFDVSQADLNWENPKVRDELKNVILFWKEKGVKGFRFDVVNLISKPEVFENDQTGDGRKYYTDGHHVHEFLKELVRDTGLEDMVTVGEMSSTTMENCILYSNPQEKEFSMCFNFHHLKVDYKDGNKWELMEPDIEVLKKLLIEWQLGMQENNGWNAVFWCNHDQPRIVSRLGDDQILWKESAKMLAASIHLLRGTPYIYQGEELGMTNPHYNSIEQYKDVESLNFFKILREQGKSEEEALKILSARSRDNGRTPMQWSKEENAGFSKAIPWISLTENYKDINAEYEVAEEDSILNFYKKLIRLRKLSEAVADGKIEFLYENVPNIFAYKRYTQSEELIIFNNFGKAIVSLQTVFHPKNYKIILGNYEKTYIKADKIKLQPYETIILKKETNY